MKNLKTHIAYLIIILLVSTSAVSTIIDAIGTYSTNWQLGKNGSIISSDTTFASTNFIEQDAFTFKKADDSTFVTIAASEIIVNYGDSSKFHFIIPVVDTVKEWISAYYGQLLMLQSNKTLVPISWSAIGDSIGSISSSTSSSIADTAKFLYDVGFGNAYTASDFVFVVGNQSIEDVKTFVDSIHFANNVTINGNFILSNTVWDDLRVPLTQGRLGINAKPDFDTTNVAYLFPQNNTSERLYIIAQMPHAWKEGTDIEPHVHWLQESADSVNWVIEYKWTDVSETQAATWTRINGNALSQAYTSGALHQITPIGTISGSGHTLSSILQIKLFRDDNLYTGDAKGLDLDLHHEIDKIGSDNEYSN